MMNLVESKQKTTRLPACYIFSNVGAAESLWVFKNTGGRVSADLTGYYGRNEFEITIKKRTYGGSSIEKSHSEIGIIYSLYLYALGGKSAMQYRCSDPGTVKQVVINAPLHSQFYFLTQSKFGRKFLETLLRVVNTLQVEG